MSGQSQATQRVWSNWSYQPAPGRDLRIDLLRGCAVVMMVIDHLAGPSALQHLTGRGQFFTSAAEGFVFIAGFIGANIYGRIARSVGARSASVRLIQRAALLYCLSVVLTLLVLPVSEHIGVGPCSPCPGMGLQLNDPLRLVWAILTMRETYYMVDIPLLYVRLLLLAPFALVLLHKRATWLLIVLSTGVWLVTQAFPTNDVLGWSVANNVTFHLPSWQFVFCAGMVLGYHRTWLAKLVRPSVYGRWLVATGLVFLGLICLYIAEHHVPGLFADAETGFFGKTNVGPGRLLVSAVVFTFLFLSVHSAWIPLRRSVGWLLLPLGQHALLAYTAHVLFGLLLVSLEASFGHWVTGSPLVDAALQIIAIGLIWLIIRWRVRLGQPPSVGRTTTTLGRLPGVAIHKLVPHPAVQSMGRVA